MVVIKNQDWNYYTGELYKSYANQHQAETTLICYDMPLSPLKVHGLILSANSEWFELILKGRYNREVPLPYKKNVMLPLIDIIYKGSADVAPHIVQELFNAACGLQIKGLNYDSINFVVKSEVLDKPGFSTSSPNRSVISPIFDIPNSTISDVSRLVKNPFAESKAEALKESKDSDETAIGSDDEVLIVDNGVTSDIDVVDDASPLRKNQSPKKVRSNGTEFRSSKIRKIESNNASGPTLRSIKNINVRRPITPLSPEVDVKENKAEALGETKDSDNTAIGSDDEVLIVDNGATSDIDMVDDASRLRKHRSPKKIRLNRTKFKASKIMKIESNDASGPTLRSEKNINVPRPITPLSPEVDVEALSPYNVCNELQQVHETIETFEVQRNKSAINTGNVEDNLAYLLEKLDRIMESRLKPDIKNKVESAHCKKMTQLCIICFKECSNILVHKQMHKPGLIRGTKYICRECSTAFRAEATLALHMCKQKRRS